MSRHPVEPVECRKCGHTGMRYCRMRGEVLYRKCESCSKEQREGEAPKRSDGYITERNPEQIDTVKSPCSSCTVGGKCATECGLYLAYLSCAGKGRETKDYLSRLDRRDAMVRKLEMAA